MSNIKLNFIERHRGRFTLLFHYEQWNWDDPVREVRLYFLLWEFNFSIKKCSNGKSKIRKKWKAK